MSKWAWKTEHYSQYKGVDEDVETKYGTTVEKKDVRCPMSTITMVDISRADIGHSKNIIYNLHTKNYLSRISRWRV